MAKTNHRNSRFAQKDQVKKLVLEQVKNYLNHLREQGLSVQRAYIFGSQVGGNTHKWSDIDVCIVSKDFNRRNDALSYLWRALRKEDVKAGIEPIGFHPDDFVENIPVVSEILHHGVQMI
ncbi:MAG: nucleotidyltransferase domain-containing protein [bacterium]